MKTNWYKIQPKEEYLPKNGTIFFSKKVKNQCCQTTITTQKINIYTKGN